MLAEMSQLVRDAAPEIWRRYLTLILDGMRPRRDGVTPLPVPPWRRMRWKRACARPPRDIANRPLRASGPYVHLHVHIRSVNESANLPPENAGRSAVFEHATPRGDA